MPRTGTRRCHLWYTFRLACMNPENPYSREFPNRSFKRDINPLTAQVVSMSEISHETGSRVEVIFWVYTSCWSLVHVITKVLATMTDIPILTGLKPSSNWQYRKAESKHSPCSHCRRCDEVRQWFLANHLVFCFEIMLIQCKQGYTCMISRLPVTTQSMASVTSGGHSGSDSGNNLLSPYFRSVIGLHGPNSHGPYSQLAPSAGV